MGFKPEVAPAEVAQRALANVRNLARSWRRRRQIGRLVLAPVDVADDDGDALAALALRLDHQRFWAALRRQLRDDPRARDLVDAIRAGAATRAQQAAALCCSEADVHNIQRRLLGRARRLRTSII